VIQPDQLFQHAWQYQVELSSLQGEINEAINDVQTLISSVLKDSTVETLGQYQSHVQGIQAEYEPMLGALEILPSSQCRSDSENLLNYTVRMTGFDASNCASVYDSRVRNEVAIANRALVRFDDLYNQVQTIVVKSFIKQNALVSPDDIKDTMIEIFELVGARWETTKPEIDSVKRNLQSKIADQNRQLGVCHTTALNWAVSAFALFTFNVQRCVDFNGSQNPLGHSGRSKRSLRNIQEEFEELVANHKSYAWE
jgi:hypothetical protein